MDYIKLAILYSLNKRNVALGFSIPEILGTLYQEPLVRFGVNVFAEVAGYTGSAFVDNSSDLLGYNKPTDYYPPILAYPKELYAYASQNTTNALTVSLLFATGGVLTSNVQSTPYIDFLYGVTLQETVKVIVKEVAKNGYLNSTVYTHGPLSISQKKLLINSLIVDVHRYVSLFILVALIYIIKNKIMPKILAIPKVLLPASKSGKLYNYFKNIKKNIKSRFKSLFRFRSKKGVPHKEHLFLDRNINF